MTTKLIHCLLGIFFAVIVGCAHKQKSCRERCAQYKPESDGGYSGMAHVMMPREFSKQYDMCMAKCRGRC